MKTALTPKRSPARFRRFPAVLAELPCILCGRSHVGYVWGGAELTFECPECLEAFDAADVRDWLREIEAALDRIDAEEN